MIVSNTTPLIYLAKIGKLDLLRILFKNIHIPKEVYNEIIVGKKDKYIDALIIENEIKKKWIIVKDINLTGFNFELQESH